MTNSTVKVSHFRLDSRRKTLDYFVASSTSGKGAVDTRLRGGWILSRDSVPALVRIGAR
jgi:hypothetical protein